MKNQIIILLGLALCPILSTAQWSPDPNVNTPVITYYFNQSRPVITSDDQGGAYIAWRDNRFSPYGLFAQRLNEQGIISWNPEGAYLGAGQTLQMSKDQAGNCHLLSHYNSKLRVQKIDNKGDTLWGYNGVPLDNNLNPSVGNDIIPDGRGGCYISYIGGNNGGYLGIARIDSAGTTIWNSPISPNGHSRPSLALNGTDGVYLSYKYNGGLYLKGLYPNGIEYSPNCSGSIKATIPGFSYPKSISDSSGNVLIAYPGGIQKVDSNNCTLWGNLGTITNSVNPELVSDQREGGIVIWQDYYNIYALRVDSTGTLHWGTSTSPALVHTGSANIVNINVTPNGLGGAMVSWVQSSYPSEIYFQEIDSSGNLLCGSNGLPVSTHAFQKERPVMTYSSPRCAIIAWEDFREVNNWSDIYAAKVCNCSLIGGWQIQANGLSGSNNSEFCGGDSVLLNVSHQPNVNYQWFQDSIPVGVDTNFFFAGSGGTYTLRSIFNSDTIYSDSIVLIENQPPQTSITNFPNPFCNNGPVIILTGTPLGGVFTLDGDTLFSNQLNPSTLGLGTHYLLYSVVDTNGCVGSDLKTFDVVQSPDPVVFCCLDSSYCENDLPVLLKGNPTSGVFSGSGIIGNYFYPDSALPGTHLIVYTDSSNNCVSKNEQWVNVNSSPLVTIGSIGSICSNSASIQLQGFPASGIFSGNGVWADSLNPSMAPIGPNLITYSKTDTTSGCTGRGTLEVIILESPGPVIFCGLEDDYCENDDPIILMENPNSGTFSGPGLPGGSVFDPQLAGTGLMVITYIDSFPNGCKSVYLDSTFIHANTLSASFTFSNVSSGTKEINFLDASIDSSSSIFSWHWDFGDGNISSLQNPTHEYVCADTYLVCLTVINGYCSDSFCTEVIDSTMTNRMMSKFDRLELFPNPNNGSFGLKGLPHGIRVSIVDILGNEIPFRMERYGTSAKINLVLPAGMYFLKAGEQTLKFLIRR